MERTRETIEPSEALKLIASTLNSPSIRHDRVDMSAVYMATAEIIAKWTPRQISITKSGVVTEGLIYMLAVVHAWKAATFDVARDVQGIRTYTRKSPKRAKEINIWEIERSATANRAS